MMVRSVLVLCPAMVTSLAACVSVQEGEGDEVGVGEQTVLVENALTSNALTSSALRDPLARQLLKYVVSCALSSGAHFDVNIDGVVYGFDGELGLHKKWGDTGGSCDNACKTWVSACVLSRINHLGLATPISMRGNKGELSSDSAEQTTYSIREGAYYGNIFANPPICYACVSPEKTSIERCAGHRWTNAFSRSSAVATTRATNRKAMGATRTAAIARAIRTASSRAARTPTPRSPSF
ncbi:hypothetical protein WME95_27155 [Sorangium sp. So ce327]|uniref:hypothetical protein n=1 Tax=Sorangium sp. So ce327 TaxID=3133301 RepID=UPI003F5F68AC